VDPENYPAVLHERLGADGVAALAEVLASYKDDAVMLAGDRFERRLAEECGQLRAEMAALRTDLKAEMSDLRTELKALRLELRADFKVEVANVRADLLKWSFVFWVGQVAAVAGLVTVLR